MHLVVNPAAAGGRLGKEWPKLQEKLRALGVDAPVSITRAPGHATELTAEAVARGADVVVAVGGDGTICEVIQGLHDARGGTLGILPLGTGNDAARTLGLPLDLEQATRVLLAGQRRRVDLMKAGDKVVFNAIGIGLLGAINIRSTSIKWVRGIGAYLVAAVANLFAYRGPTVRLNMDGNESVSTMLILAIHNGPTTGGGFRLTPGAIPDDGLLDACLVEDIRILGRFPRLLAALQGTLGTKPGSHPFRFRRMELGTDVALPAHLDGNPVYIEPPGMVFEVLPGALSVASSPPTSS